LLNELEISKRQAPDPHLQAEVKSLLVEKNELEKRIDSLTKAKQHYKLQWSRAIKVNKTKPSKKLTRTSGSCLDERAGNRERRGKIAPETRGNGRNARKVSGCAGSPGNDR
jgi:hypothetical protein